MPCRQVCRRRQARPERQHPIGFQLGLAALVASGHGDVPLFKLRCAARAGHRVVVSGQSYNDPYRGCDLGNDPSCDGSTTIRSASAIASSRLVRGALRDDGRRGVVPQSAPRLPVCRRCNNRRRVPHGDRRQRSTLTVASLPSLVRSAQLDIATPTGASAPPARQDDPRRARQIRAPVRLRIVPGANVANDGDLSCWATFLPRQLRWINCAVSQGCNRIAFRYAWIALAVNDGRRGLVLGIAFGGRHDRS